MIGNARAIRTGCRIIILTSLSVLLMACVSLQRAECNRCWFFDEQDVIHGELTGFFRGRESREEVEPNEFVPFTAASWGITGVVPYNKDWGTDSWFMRPYDATSAALVFGPLVGVEGGGVARAWGVTRVPPRGINDIYRECVAREEIDYCHPLLGASLDTVEIASHAYCRDVKYEIVGDNFNYVVSSRCTGVEFADDWLRHVAMSIRLRG